MISSKDDVRKFAFGTLIYEYFLIPQDRKSLSLTVTPDLGIFLKCPHEADEARIEQFLRKKWFWLEKQLLFFRRYQRKHYEKEYLSGESVHYLGRQYKLLIRSGSKDRVVLKKGLFNVETTQSTVETAHTKKLINRWLRERIDAVFTQQFELSLSQFGYSARPVLEIKHMQKRWGSYREGGVIVLNPKLIHCPKYCIEYVIIHELCHVRFKNHDKRFYNFLKKHCPDWEHVKEKLEQFGAGL